jgi:GST-like protein
MFLPADPLRQTEALEWLMWQMGRLGPMPGQGHHYMHFYPGTAECVEERFMAEVESLYGVHNARLERRDYICDEDSIDDMACWPSRLVQSGFTVTFRAAFGAPTPVGSSPP